MLTVYAALNTQGEHACASCKPNAYRFAHFCRPLNPRFQQTAIPKFCKEIKRWLIVRSIFYVVEAHFVSFPPFPHIWKLLASLSVYQTTVTQCAKLGKTYPWQVVAKALTVFFHACELNVRSLTLGWTYVFNFHPLPQHSTGLISFSFSFRTNLFNLPNCHFPAQHKTGQDCVRTNESSTENSGIRRKRPKQ